MPITVKSLLKVLLDYTVKAPVKSRLLNETNGASTMKVAVLSIVKLEVIVVASLKVAGVSKITGLLKLTLL